MKRMIPDEVVVRTLKDYLTSGDSTKAVAQRNGVTIGNIGAWLKKIGLKPHRRLRDWGAIKTLVTQ